MSSGSKSIHHSGVEQISTCIKRLMWNKFQLSSDSSPTNMFVCTVHPLHATGVGRNCSSDTFELKSGIGTGQLSAWLGVMPHKFAEDSQQLDRLFYQLKLHKCPKVGVSFYQINLKSATHGCIPCAQKNIYWDRMIPHPMRCWPFASWWSFGLQLSDPKRPGERFDKWFYLPGTCIDLYIYISLSTYMQYMRRALFPALSDCCGSKKGRASFWYNMCWGGWTMASSWMLHMALSPRHAQAGIFCGLVQEYQLYEFFAGKANLSKCSRASGLRTASFDILFDPSQPHHGSNCMDINSGSGFALFGLNSDVELGYAGYTPLSLTSSCFFPAWC